MADAGGSDLFGYDGGEPERPERGMVRACRAPGAARIVAAFRLACILRPGLAQAGRPRAGVDALGGFVRGMLGTEFDNSGRRFYAALAGLRFDCGPVPEALRPKPEEVAAEMRRLESVARMAVAEMERKLARGVADG